MDTKIRRIKAGIWRGLLNAYSKTIRYAFKRSEKSGYVDNFAIAGGLKEGKYQSVYPFDDAEVFKIIEGASYLLMVQKDAELESFMDSIISIIRDIQ